MNVQRGMRGKLDAYLNPEQDIEIRMTVSGGAVYDYCCFGVDEHDRLSDDRYMVFYNQPRTPDGAITYTPDNGQARFSMRLNQLPQAIHKLVFTVSIDGRGIMSNIASHTLEICQNSTAALELRLNGADFQREKAIISLEIYRRNGWRFAVIARGFNGGLGDLLRSYGGTEETSPPSANSPTPTTATNQSTATAANSPTPVNRAAPINPTPPVNQPISLNRPATPTTPNPTPPVNQPISLNRPTTPTAANPAASGNPIVSANPLTPQRIELRRGQKVSLQKRGGSPGEIRLHFHWQKSAGRGNGIFAPKASNADLNFGCLYELKDGHIGCIQALGGLYGDFNRMPYAVLEQEPYTSTVTGGQNLRINGAMTAQIRRILVYAFIYEGDIRWREAAGMLTVHSPGGPEITVRMDEYSTIQRTCAVAMLENVNDETFSVEKIMRFFDDQSMMDKAFDWGLRWKPGNR